MGTHPGYPAPPPPPVPPPPPPRPEPTPPRGPGVLAPFPAPPREHNPRIWIGLGAAALALVLIVVGGVVGVVEYGLHRIDSARATVDRFLTAVEAQRYTAAYRMQCRAARQGQTRHEFAAQFSGGHRLVGHTLSTPEAVDVGGTSAFAVPARLEFANNAQGTLRVVVIPESAGGSDFAVCGTQR